MRVLEVRRQRAGDETAIRAVHRAAFARGNGEPIEVDLVDALRADLGWLPHLARVALVRGTVVGHVVATRATVDGDPALGVGPLGVLPAVQRHGVGTALMYALVGAAQACGETLVGLLGEPAYYGRFGFVAATDVGITPPDPGWGRYFQVLVAGGPSSTGPFRYAAPFDDLV